MRFANLGFSALMICVGAAFAAETAQWHGLPVGQVQVGGQALRVVAAGSSRERAVSLGRYADLQTGEGVLHSYDQTGKRCLLTQDIPVDLDAAYLDDTGNVVEVGVLVAAQQQVQCAEKPARRVLTVAKGQLAAYGVKVGDTVSNFTPLTAQALARVNAQADAQREQERAQQRRQDAQDRQAPPRVTLTLGGKTLNPLLVFLHGTGGMDSAREDGKVPLANGWLYVFATDVPAGTCRNPDQIHGELWERLTYHQYAFARDGRMLGHASREDGKLCAEGGAMRYALVLPHDAAVLQDTARLTLVQSMQALARQRFDAQTIRFPATGHYHYACNAGLETMDAMLTVNPMADGNVTALLDILISNGKSHAIDRLKMEMKGIKNAAGNYDFSPARTLNASARYKVQRVTEVGALPLDHLSVAMQGMQCNTPAADFAYASFDEKSWQATAFDTQQKLTRENVQFLAKNYDIAVQYEVGSSRVEGGQDAIPGMLAKLFGAKTTLDAWAYQCSNRIYRVTIRPKADIAYAGSERYPFAVPINWQLVQNLGGSSTHVHEIGKTYQLPVRRADSVSDTVEFGCVAELHTMRGTEQTAQLRAQVGDKASSVGVHRAEWTRPINRDAVYAEDRRQTASLLEKINAENASNARVADNVQRQMAQDEANKKQAEALKKALACEREKAKNHGNPNFLFSDC